MIEIQTEMAATPSLSITPDDAFFILAKAREFDAEVPDEEDPEYDPDAPRSLLKTADADSDNAVEQELTAAIRRLSDDAQLDLITLIWIGRGDFSLAEWTEAREAARDIGRARLPRYVRGIPLVSDYLDEALAQCGFSLEDYFAA
jgi:hypothetical protein